jgi:hypothetical protein
LPRSAEKAIKGEIAKMIGERELVTERRLLILALVISVSYPHPNPAFLQHPLDRVEKVVDQGFFEAYVTTGKFACCPAFRDPSLVPNRGTLL